VESAEQVDVATVSQWRAWLRRHHHRDAGVWLVFYKRSSGRATVEYEELVCEALCWGWIDSKTGRVDEARTRQWFAPRRSKSAWSPSNVARVARLVKEGRMQPAGLRAVELAKAGGRWVEPVEVAGPR
jgi:uncharacterized protein YdeI (YjbR/CyaY-like superfamily)